MSPCLRGCIFCLWAVLIVSCRSFLVAAIPEEPEEISAYQIKAAFLYNFFLFVNWPYLPEKQVTIGIFGEDPFGASFLDVESKMMKGLNKQLVIKRLSSHNPETEISQCQILFVCASERHRWNEILPQLAGKPVLTVGDQAGFLEAGGMLNFLLIRNKVRWEINRAVLNGSGLRMDSQLLESAIRILAK